MCMYILYIYIYSIYIEMNYLFMCLFTLIYVCIICILIDCKAQPNAIGHRRKQAHTQSNLVRKSNCFQHVLHPK